MNPYLIKNLDNNNMTNSNNNMNFNPNNNMNFNPNNNKNFNIINNLNNFNPNNNMINSNNNMNFNPNNNIYLNPNKNMNPNLFPGNNNIINYNIHNMNINMNNTNNNFNLNSQSNINNINNFIQPSNLFLRGKSCIKNGNECLRMEFFLNHNNYILEIQQILEHNCLYFFCNMKDDITLLEEYSCVQTFKELKKLNDSFNMCENITQMYNVLKKIFLQRWNDAKPRIDCINDKIILFFLIPHLPEKYDDVTIELEKKERDLKEQFHKLSLRYVEISQVLREIQNICNSFGTNNSKLKEIKSIVDDIPRKSEDCFII